MVVTILALQPVEGFIADLKMVGIPFRKTVTLTSADVPLQLRLYPTQTLELGSAYILPASMPTSGATEAGADWENNVIRAIGLRHRCRNHSRKSNRAVANAQSMFGSNGNARRWHQDGTGMTEAKGLEIVADGAFDTGGSDLIVTITGFIGNVPA